ncbi:MAG: hypothetical protein QXX87_01085 [Candidatus Jordarchaeales archaeon]
MRSLAVTFSIILVILLASLLPAASLALPASPTAAGNVEAEQRPSYKLNLAVPIYYVQESGDVILFVFLAVDSAGVKAAVTFGNGTTGWHFAGSSAVTQDYFNPVASINVEGKGYLIVAAFLLKNVWPSGWRIVDQCFGMVPSFDDTTSMPYAVTFNQDFRMILIYSVKATAL